MKYHLAVLSFAVFMTRTAGQSSWSLRAHANLGVGIGAIPSIVDYATLVGRPQNRIGDLQSIYELSGGVDVRPDLHWTAGFDVARMMRTVYAARGDGSPEWAFDLVWQTYAVVLRSISVDEAVSIEWGGGAGYCIGTMTERFESVGLQTSYTGRGAILIVQALASTPLSDSFRGIIAVDIRGAIIGDATTASGAPPTAGSTTASLGYTAIVLRFGVAFQG